MRDPTFITGFVTGIIATIVVAAVAGKVAALWNRLRQPFMPTTRPGRLPVEKGPSPVQEFLNWLGSVIMIATIIAIIGLLIWMVMNGESG